MRRLKGSADNAHVYHTASFRPQYYSSDRPQKAAQQYHDHEYQQQEYNHQNYHQFLQQQQQHTSSLDMSTDSLTRMQHQSYKQQLQQGRALLETSNLRQAGGGQMAASQTLPAHVPHYMRGDGGVRADMVYQVTTATNVVRHVT
jgi:small-conductance mechanosensitive channel